MDDDFPPATTPRFWIAFSILCIAFASWVIVATCRTAAAQELCFPLPSLIDELGKKFGEVIVWEGAAENVETMLFQSPKETWTLVRVQGGNGCIIGAGKHGTPVGETGEEV